jgi:hypothetical protein
MPSVYLITPLTKECQEWLEDNVSEDAQYFGHSLAVEHRYVESLLWGLEQNGFKCERDFEINY